MDIGFIDLGPMWMQEFVIRRITLCTPVKRSEAMKEKENELHELVRITDLIIPILWDNRF